MAEHYLQLAAEAEQIARLMSLRDDRSRLLDEARRWRDAAAALALTGVAADPAPERAMGA